MCGRFAQTSFRSRYADMLHMREPGENVGDVIPQYDLRPGMCPTLIHWFETKPALFGYYWGFLPAWSKEAKGPGGMRPINARVETAAANGMFRHAWTHQRCLIPADAFYEWKVIPGVGKQRYCLRRADHEPMMFAGLWDHWRPKDGGEEIPTCVILTGEPNAVAGAIHDRMPVILAPETWEAWLSPELRDARKVRELVSIMPAEDMEAYPVVNNGDGPELLEPLKM